MSIEIVFLEDPVPRLDMYNAIHQEASSFWLIMWKIIYVGIWWF
jgi:hypothetical protein